MNRHSKYIREVIDTQAGQDGWIYEDEMKAAADALDETEAALRVYAHPDNWFIGDSGDACFIPDIALGATARDALAKLERDDDSSL